MRRKTLKIAWISDFPVEWLDNIPEVAEKLPRQHPMAWFRCLLQEVEKDASIHLHILILRKELKKNHSFERHGVTFHLIKTMRFTRALSFFWMDTWLIRKCLKRIQPDLVHAVGSERGAALVVTRLPYAHLISIQGLMTWVQETVPLSLHDSFAAVLERYTFRKTHIVSAESVFAADFLRKRFSNLRVEQIEHVPAPLFHEVVRKPQLDPVRFVFVGTFNFAKGGDLLLKAMDDLLSHQVPFELIIMGKEISEFRNKMRSEVSPGLWKKVRFKGVQTSLEVAEELSRATLMICPTRVDTGPIAVKEAVVAGVPVVGSEIGGIPEYVVPGKNGLLFPSGDLVKCLAAIKEALKHPLFSKGLVDSQTLWEKRSYLSPVAMATKFINLYQEIASE